MNNMVIKKRGRAMTPLVQIIVTVFFITIFFLGVIIIHKKNKKSVLSEEQRREQKRLIYEALREIVSSERKTLIEELSEKIELREGDSLDGKQE